ncbi:MAG: HupE/UreJ family protein [Pseudomonadota bacterium]
MRHRIVFACILFLLTGLFSQNASAHTRSQSYSVWTVDGAKASFTFSVDARRVTQLAPAYEDQKSLTDILREHLNEVAGVTQNGNQCDRVEFRVTGEARPTLTAEGTFQCEENIGAEPINVRMAAFFGVSPTHVHIARVVNDAGSEEYVLRRGRSTFLLSETPRPENPIGFALIGFHHVISGLDHILFLLALALAAPSLRTGLLSVTGFTLGHMLTLALVATRSISPNSILIEAIIGLTIAAAAAEAAAPKISSVRLGGLNIEARPFLFFGLAAIIAAAALAPIAVDGVLLTAAALSLYAVAAAFFTNNTATRLLPAFAAVFGLAHGAGFAGGLLDLNLETERLFAPVLAFNIGVEAAQLIALVGAFAGLALARRLLRAKVYFAAQNLILSALIAVGVYWFSIRIWA